MDKGTASEQITDEVSSWPGMEAGPGRRGEFAFRVSGSGGPQSLPRRAGEAHHHDPERR